MLLLTLGLYIAVGLCIAVLACFIRRQCMPGVVAGGIICGAFGAFTAGVLWGPSIGPVVAGISVLPCFIGAVIAVGTLEMLAQQLFVKLPQASVIPFPGKQGPVVRKTAA